MTDIRSLSLPELTEVMKGIGEKPFRAKQIWEWLWKKSATSFEEMTNLSKELRQNLAEVFTIRPASPDVIQRSTDGTIKAGFKLHDERVVEGVMIPADDRMTACVSSQVGCTLSCAFCATGQLKRERNLEAGEIYDQVVQLNRMAMESQGHGLTNIVYMGMGEPLLNYDNVMRSIERITHEDGLHMSPKRITVSTVGIARGIKRLADEGKKFNLALSLHAATDEKRNRIMDINRSNPIDSLVETMNYFYEKTGNKITFEYIMFDHFNDTAEDAAELARLCKRVPAFVNLIEYNYVEGVTLKKAKSERRNAFVQMLEEQGVNVKVRRSRGKDIDAACGQLANKH